MYFQLLSLIVILYKNGYCLPSHGRPLKDGGATPQGPIDGDIWSIVDRRPGLPDIIIPSLCPSPCQNLFKAQPVNISGTECACRCSVSTPAFLQSIGQCSNQIDECQQPIRFKDNIDSPFIPLFVLPPPLSVIAPTADIKWTDANVKLIPSIGARCNITAVYYLKDDRLWQEAFPHLFYIGWYNNNARIFWNGTTINAKHLEGTVIQLKLDCFGQDKNAHCLSFRLAGQAGPLLSSKLQQFSSNSQGRLETIVIILLLILLILSLLGSIILWNVCWGLKKSKLISSIQMHILYQMKQDKEKESNNPEAIHRYQSITRNSNLNNNDSGFDISAVDDQTDMVQPVAIKRKLIFSAEFFERQFMVNPPPMAEQFLHDLRKMIEIAKQRINLRRHIPQLLAIPEEKKEDYEPYMELEERRRQLQVMPPEHDPLGNNEENSPQSIKSTDSGRESMKDASSVESVASSTDSQRQTRSPVPLLPNGGVKHIINDFEKTKMSPPLPEAMPNLKKNQSKIPVINTFTKSPRMPIKSMQPAQQLFAEAPPLPPRNNIPVFSASSNNQSSKKGDEAPPLPPTPPPSRTKEESMIPVTNNNTHTRRKTYAVFPTDPMLKKSLPRRTKKKPPSPINGIVESNI